MASEQQHRVSPRYWTGDRRTWPDREKLLGLYLLTCEHRSTEGFYRMPKGYIATDLGWSARHVEESLERVIQSGFVLYDHDAEVVLLPTALKRQRPSTENQIAGAVRKLAMVPANALWDAFLAVCDEHCPKLAEAIRMDRGFHSNGHSNTHGDGNSGGDGDALRAGARTFSISNSISSSSIPPSPPKGGRQRERDSFEEAMTAYVAEHFPDQPVGLIKHHAATLRYHSVEPTAEAIQAMLDHNRDGAAA